VSASHGIRPGNVSATSGELDARLAETARGQLAQKLGVDVARMKPCVGMLPPQDEGRAAERLW